MPLAQPGVWTPIFFLDDAVALAAGHRPCGRCRRADYLAYQRAVSPGPEGSSPLSAGELDRRLAGERLRPGQGLERREDRRPWKEPAAELPDGTVIVHEGTPHLLVRDRAFAFSFAGWGSPRTRPEGTVDVLTPPTSVAALRRGFRPRLHRSATDQLGTWTPMEMR